MTRSHANSGPVLRLVRPDGDPPHPTDPAHSTRAPLSTPVRKHPADDAARRAVALETRLAGSLSTHDARWIFAVAVASSLVGGRSAMLPVDARKRLLSRADGMGLRPFDANLVIAVVQDAQREGRALSRETQERLTLVRPADPDRIASPGRYFIASLILSAVMMLALAAWVYWG